MAVVYLARHAQLNSWHAVKVVTAHSGSSRDRLVQEGRVQSTLRHPNLVSVTDLVLFEGAPVLVMEFIRGPSLADWLDRYRPSLGEIDRVARGVLEGMAFAHQAGVIHRDVKPANVLMEIQGGELVPKVADFGLVKIAADVTAKTTRQGAVMGTPAYMAPEQHRDASEVDARADVFALGALLYELVSDRQAFEADDMVGLINAICDGRYPRLDDVVPGVPARMARAIEGALRPDREHRIATVEQLLDVWCRDDEGAVVELPRRRLWSAAALDVADSLAPPVDRDSSLSTEPVTLGGPGSASTIDIDLASVDDSAATVAPPVASVPNRRKMWLGLASLVAVAVVLAVGWVLSDAPVRTLTLHGVAEDSPAQVRFREGMDAIYLGEFEKAERVFETVSAEHAQDPALHLMIGLNRCLLAQTWTCIAAVHQADQMASGAGTPASQLARLVSSSLTDTESADQINAQWDAFLVAHPELLPAHLARVLTVHDLDHDNWIRHLDDAMARFPEVVIFHGLKANFLGASGRAAEAEALLLEALEAFPASSFLKVHLALLYRMEGRVEDQRKVLDTLMREDPGYGEVLQMMAEHALATGDDQALRELTETVRAPTTPVAKQITFARRHLLLLYGRGRAREADAWVDFCAETASQNGDPISVVDCYKNASGAYYHYRLLDEALAWAARFRDAYDRAEIHPRVRTTFMTTWVYYQGLAALRRGDVEGAVAEFRRLEHIHEDDFGHLDKGYLTRLGAAEIASARGDVDAALKHLDGMKRPIDACEESYLYGTVYLRAGRMEDLAPIALDMADRACDQLPILRIVRAGFLVELAAYYAAERREDEATEVLAMFEQAWPDADADNPWMLRAATIAEGLGWQEP